MKRMSWRRGISRLAAALMGMVLALSICATAAFAYEHVDTSAQASLAVTFSPQEAGAISDAEFRLYKVADVSDAVVFTATAEFAGAKVSLNDVSSASAWADLAVTFSAYAGINNLSADFTGTTDGSGGVSFSNLGVGLYLLVGDTVVVGDYAYAPTPAMIVLPTLLADNTWDYDPAVTAKVTRTFLTRYQNLTVKKVWDDGNREGRPASVEAQLLRDGHVQETVTLNRDNFWTYTWENLTSTYEGENSEGQTVTKTYTYTVNEKTVPAGYTVAVSQNGENFTVTNTYRNSYPSDSILPQTGTLNWPIPVLAISGMLLVGLGWFLLTRKKEC